MIPTVTQDNEVVIAELGSEVFASLRRADQRRTAMEYLRGMLSVSGRKNARNLATCAADPAAEQRFHHFVAGSCWDWQPVREALTGFLGRVAPPRAWVARPLVLTKTGDCSVGVERRYVPEAGQSVNAQFGWGLWQVSNGFEVPVNWYLHLPESWLSDPVRRKRARIPTGYLPPASAEDGAVRTVLETVARQPARLRPVISDARHAALPTLLRGLGAARVPALLRINGSVPVVLADRKLQGFNCRPLPAHQLLSTAGSRVRTALRPGGRGSVAALRVLLPGLTDSAVPAATRQDGRGALTLVGEWSGAGPWPDQVWLTDVTAPAHVLHEASELPEPHADALARAAGAGLRDYGGRSFQGWHRHMTMVSVALAARALTAGTGDTAPMTAVPGPSGSLAA
ncbi:IS701 family transposase [Streptomyces sclerotialus]|uniref:IS701 family transposase n=1 Tax=Streptomyces sclerotialus TaxID=1957 RepID=UPI0006907D43